jgi:hypothetical protein
VNGDTVQFLSVPRVEGLPVHRPLTVAAAVLAAMLLAGCQVLAPPARPATTAAPASGAGPARPEVPVDRADAWEDVWAVLERRPLHLPPVAPGDPCPVSETEPIVGVHGLGRGPVYAVGPPDGVVRYGGIQEVPGWHVAKVLWLAGPWYRGPALVRGKRLDAAGELVFPLADGPPRASLRFPLWNGVSSPDVPEGWRQQPSWVGFRAPGCYAVQVDALNFSRTIVFRAEPGP